MKRVLPLLLVGCALGPTGDVRIDLEAEDTITDGLAAGTGEENVVDGWSISYTQFVVTIGRVHLARTATGAMRASSNVEVIDLVSFSATGSPLAAFTGLEVARWDAVGFSTPAASSSATRDPSVSERDFDEMVANGCTFLLAGSLDGPSHLDFRLCVPSATDYGPCSTPDGMSGVAVVAAATTPAHVTIHGDHLWFDAFPSGAEATVERRAQWMIDCDVDHDGVATESELRAMPAARVLTTTRSYDLAGAPSVDGHGIQTAWDWVRAQMSTVGHFQGEGECPWAPTSASP